MVNIHARNCLSSPRKFDRSRAATSQVSASMSSAAAGSNPRRNRSNRECISCQRTAIAQCAPSWAAASTSANSVVATSADDLRFELFADVSAHDVDHDVLDRSEWRMLTSSPLARLGAEYPDCPGHEMGQSGACKALWPDCVVGNACLRRRAGRVRGHRGRLRSRFHQLCFCDASRGVHRRQGQSTQRGDNVRSAGALRYRRQQRSVGWGAFRAISRSASVLRYHRRRPSRRVRRLRRRQSGLRCRLPVPQPPSRYR
jgi:hypothetical protein